MLFRGFWENLEKPIIGLAPMDGVTDAAFRYMVCKYAKESNDVKRRFPSVIITEFTNVEGLARGAVEMLKAFIYDEIERPIVAQIYGVEPESFYKCAVMLCAMGFDGIDINMGCPANKVARQGSGAGLIRTPELAKELVLIVKKAVKDWAEGITLEKAGVHPEVIAAVKKMVEDGKVGVVKKFDDETLDDDAAGGLSRKLIPVSVKTRIGYDSIVAEDWMKHLTEVCPANITVHGRTLKQMYMGESNWEILAKSAKIVQKCGISFLGNGDVKSMADAREKIREYGVDGVLVGRATFGNPWLFMEKNPSNSERLAAACEHVRYYIGLKHMPFHNIKKHLAWYCRGFEGVKELRMNLMQSNSGVEAEKLIQNAMAICE